MKNTTRILAIVLGAGLAVGGVAWYIAREPGKPTVVATEKSHNKKKKTATSKKKALTRRAVAEKRKAVQKKQALLEARGAKKAGSSLAAYSDGKSASAKAMGVQRFPVLKPGGTNGFTGRQFPPTLDKPELRERLKHVQTVQKRLQANKVVRPADPPKPDEASTY